MKLHITRIVHLAAETKYEVAKHSSDGLVLGTFWAQNWPF